MMAIGGGCGASGCGAGSCAVRFELRLGEVVTSTTGAEPEGLGARFLPSPELSAGRFVAE